MFFMSIKSIKSTKSTNVKQATFFLDVFYGHKNAGFFVFVRLHAFCAFCAFLAVTGGVLKNLRKFKERLF